MSLFGKPVGTPGTPAGNLFGGASTTPATAPTGGLFGSTTPAPSGGLFGSTTPATAPSSGGGLFGSAAPTAPAASSAGGGLFGSTTPATTSAPSGGLFGAGAATTTPAAPATGGLFGSATPAAPATSTSGGGLFGSAAPAAAAPSGGLFGTPTATNTTSNTGRPGLFSGAGTMSGLSGTQQQQQQSQMIPAATIDATKLTPTTRFGDCHQSVQQVFEQIEADIENQIKLSNDLADRFPAHRDALEIIPIDASALTHRLETIISLQASDQAVAEQVRAHHEADNNASQLSIRTLDLFRLPHAQRSQYIQRASTYSAPQRENEITGNKPMIAYFNKQADDMEQKMNMITKIVRQVEDSLGSVESQTLQGAMGMDIDGRDSSGGASGRQDAKRLHNTLKEFHDALRGVSGRIVDAREALEVLKGRR